MKTSDSQSTPESKPKVPAGKASPAKAKKVAKATEAEALKSQAAKKVTAKKVAVKKTVAKKVVAKKSAARKVARTNEAEVASVAAEPLVPRLERAHIADAAYFRFQKRLAYGHSPDPVADWFAAEAELMTMVGSD